MPSNRSKWSLTLEAQMWRSLMAVGMRLHTVAAPVPPSPSKAIVIPTTISPYKGKITLQVYFSDSYASSTTERRYPVVVNFHGGGFAMGTATDDARWTRSVLVYTDAVVVSVDYRLAPEFPFPTAVEDSVDAVLYVVQHASELKIDTEKIALSGFSAGGNLAFAVPLRLAEEYRLRANTGTPIPPSHRGKIVSIASWYPVLDWTVTIDERRQSNPRPDKEMPRFFKSLFRNCYLYNATPKTLESPYLSPLIASDEVLSDLPPHIFVYTCEWDGLQIDGERIYKRMSESFPSKSIIHKKLLGVAHGFDKQPNPVAWNPKIEELYKEMCNHLSQTFSAESVVNEEQVERVPIDGEQKVIPI